MAWPWHVVDTDGTVYRLGPNANPDGGILRLVMPDGTIYTQSPTGAPLTIVDSAGYPYPLGQLPFDGGWITPAPFEFTGDISGDTWRSYGSTHDEVDFAASCAEAWAEFDATAGVALEPGMRLHFTGVTHIPEHDGEGKAIVDEGFLKVTYISVLTDGENAYSYPTGAEMHPDDVAILTSTRIVGQIGTGAVASPVSNPTSIRQVDIANYDVITGPVWHTPALIDAAPIVVPQVVGEHDALYDFDFEVAWDEVGGGAQKAAMYVTSIDDYAPGGSGWVLETTHAVRLFSPDGTGAPQYVATVQMPRYRVPPVDPDVWLPNGADFMWDAGLYLGADYADLTGFPAALPTGPWEFGFFVMGPDATPATSSPDDYAYAYIYDIGGGMTDSGGPDITGSPTPLPGAHLWAYWRSFGDPPAVSPASVVPAALAANGTG